MQNFYKCTVQSSNSILCKPQIMHGDIVFVQFSCNALCKSQLMHGQLPRCMTYGATIQLPQDDSVAHGMANTSYFNQ